MNPSNKIIQKPSFKEDIENMKKIILFLLNYLFIISDINEKLNCHTPCKTFIISKLNTYVHNIRIG